MRYELLLLIAMLLTFNSCEDQNTLSKLNGTYSGVLIELKQNLLNGNLTSTEIDSFQIQLTISNETFERIFSQKICPGEISVDGEMITFDSSDCNCHCDCSPFEICDGDLILGEYLHHWSGNTLSLNYEIQKDTLRTIGNDYLGFRHVKDFTLEKE